MTTVIEPLSATAAVTSLAVVAVRHRDITVVARAMVAVALASSLATFALVRTGHPGWAGATVLEIAALAVPITLIVRSAGLNRRLAAGCVFAGIAGSAVILRYVDVSLPMALASMALWSAPAAGAAGAGLYLRTLDARRARAVSEAARTQRLALARDLHDFVAHDVTGVVVQAQAARTIADRDPRRAVAVLDQIEATGLRALDSIDRALELLREDPVLDLRTLIELAHGFKAPGGAEFRLDADPDALDRLDDESARAAHRIAVETLTNVRRHSPGATRVDVQLRTEPQAVRLTVTNDVVGGSDLGTRRPGGTGLAQLAVRVAERGGRFTAGPIAGDRWRVIAELPVAR